MKVDGETLVFDRIDPDDEALIKTIRNGFKELGRHDIELSDKGLDFKTKIDELSDEEHLELNAEEASFANAAIETWLFGAQVRDSVWDDEMTAMRRQPEIEEFSQGQTTSVMK